MLQRFSEKSSFTRATPKLVKTQTTLSRKLHAYITTVIPTVSHDLVR